MDLLVPFQILPPTEALSALVAEVRLLPCVDPLVFFQVSCLAKTPSTLYAAIGLLSCMTTLVDSQVPDSAERLSTYNTGVRVISPEVLHPDFSPIKCRPVDFCKPMPSGYGMIRVDKDKSARFIANLWTVHLGEVVTRRVAA